MAGHRLGPVREFDVTRRLAGVVDDDALCLAASLQYAEMREVGRLGDGLVAGRVCIRRLDRAGRASRDFARVRRMTWARA
jgi:hypothetical protein